ncbi:uncharacterized protein [Amphiura filiformis]|uniref:uncharacterized protein n=1 Tax=Amphiura filiformis TaxID=82378 RepID=UPI003B222730
MENIIQSGFAEPVPDHELETAEGSAWYIPHHGVYHSKKPDKIRVVFDCSARFKGESLNENLLQGPDLTNALVGVLCRFRQEPIAFMCDVEQMFFQFRVAAEHKDYLRFLWWENGNCDSPPKEFRMNVHLFEQCPPACANFGLKRLAEATTKVNMDLAAANFIRQDFYVDDGLSSVPTSKEAIDLIHSTKLICAKGGLRLHKFMSNSKEVMAAIPAEDRAKGIQDLDLLRDSGPVERALGVHWCIESDSFQFELL